MPIFNLPRAPLFPDQVDIILHHRLTESQACYPLALTNVREQLIQKCKKKYGLEGYAGENDVLPRIDKVELLETSLTTGSHLNIEFSLTTFGSMWATNESLDCRVIPRWNFFPLLKKSIREAYCTPFSVNFENSPLANAVGVEIAVISRNNDQIPVSQLIIRRRSQHVLFYRGHFQISAAGYLNLSHSDSRGLPSPYVTAITESREEIAHNLLLDPEQFRLVGMAIKWEDLHPAFYGYIETERSVHDLFSDWREDEHEGTMYALPFQPESVLSHISENPWTPQSALTAITALLAFFPKESIEAIAENLPMRPAKSFFEYAETKV